MPRLRIDVPVWLQAAARVQRARFPVLGRNLAVDVAVVGGGITGAAVAWRFAEAGVRVALVEGKRIGRGSTAASTALLMQEPDEDFAGLMERYGRQRAKRIWQLSRKATQELIDTLNRLAIACDLERRDSVYYAMTAKDARRLRTEHRLRTEAGIRGQWLEGAALQRTLGFGAAGAIRTRGNAQVDPYKASVGLMGAAAAAGAKVFERSPVLAITPSRKDVMLETARGSIRADRVVIATGYTAAFDTLRPSRARRETPYFKALDARFQVLTTYVIATRPLTPSERRRVGLDRVMLWDTERPYHYARWTPDHRLLLGGGDRSLRSERERARALAESTRGVEDHFHARFPALADVPLEYGWEGLFANTPDGLPYIGPHRRYGRQLFALGYGGNGMTMGFLAARLLLDWYRGDRSTDHELFAFSR
jgi:glycine/D-amino acid oxidase-like deaminating enzyme